MNLVSQHSRGWIYSCALSGLLLGLSVPNFSWLPLGFLAWAWLVPLLLELKKTEKLTTFLAQTLIAVGIGFSLITLWVVNASVIGLFASVIFGTIVWTIPLLIFYPIRRFFGWNTALWMLPPIWTAWEWIYHGTQLSFGAVRLGYTQSDLLWLIQYADLTGVEGVTFWLVLLNVALFLLIEQFLDKETPKFNFRFFLNFRRGQVTALLPALFVLPLGYAAFVFLKPPMSAGEITILAVQPNVSPYLEYSDGQMTEIYGKQFALTEKGLKKSAPDLILWHEGAVPYVLSENAAANNYLAQQLKKWNAPVLTGVIEVKNYADGELRPLLLEAQNRRREFFNTAILFAPSQIKDDRLPINLSEVYLKRRLMPFLEHVPYSDEFPWLADLIIPIGARPRLSAGHEARVLEFQAKDGTGVKIGTLICYENLYPEMSAEMVGGGAQVLTAITNESFFADSQGQYQLAAFSRFRSIETRRAMVRAAATGITRATDKFGRVTAEVPTWSEQTMQVRVALSDEQTVYVRFGDWLPKACLLTFFLPLFSVFRQRFFRPDNFKP